MNLCTYMHIMHGPELVIAISGDQNVGCKPSELKIIIITYETRYVLRKGLPLHSYSQYGIGTFNPRERNLDS